MHLLLIFCLVYMVVILYTKCLKAAYLSFFSLLNCVFTMNCINFLTDFAVGIGSRLFLYKAEIHM